MPADLSRVRNAFRDMAESMRRFEKNYERMQRESMLAMEEGATEPEVTAAANEALRGHPDLQARVRDFTSRLTQQQEGEHRG